MQCKVQRLDFAFNVFLSPSPGDEGDVDQKDLQKMYEMGLFAGVTVADETAKDQRIVEAKMVATRTVWPQ